MKRPVFLPFPCVIITVTRKYSRTSGIIIVKGRCRFTAMRIIENIDTLKIVNVVYFSVRPVSPFFDRAITCILFYSRREHYAFSIMTLKSTRFHFVDIFIINTRTASILKQN